MANTNTITIGKIGFNTCIYSSSATYNKNDVILYSNSLYVCIQDNSSASDINDTTKFVQAIKGITPKGAYDSSAIYSLNDIVIYNNSAYICKTDGVTELPTDTTKWMQLATPSLNCGFGINNRYALSAPDSDLLALWNLFHNGSMDGEQTLYGMTLVNNDKAVPVLANPAPYHDSLIKYQLSTQPDNTGKCNDSGIHVNIPSFAMDTVGDESEINEEVKIFQNALDFSTTKIRDCIVPRTEIDAVNINTPLEVLRNEFVESGHSKIIVYREDIDNIVGYVHSSEMFRLKPNDKWTACIRELPIVPETMTAQRLMKQLMQEKKSMAVVVDEFGGTSGIVTLEDLMEEVFGEIEDEHDTTNYTAKDLGNGEYLLSARLEIENINERFDLDLPESDEYLTLGGLILHEYQSFPKLNEVVKFGHWEFKIMKNTTTKIELVRLKVVK